MDFNRNIPFNSLPLLPPSTEVIMAKIENRKILKKAIEANRMLAELKSKSSFLPDPAVLIDNLTLLEAKDSSEIENIFTTHDKLFQADALLEQGADSHTKEVMRYHEALWHGVKSIETRPLSTNTLIEIVQVLRQNSAEIRQTTGTRIATPEGEVIYTPPEGEVIIREKLANLEQFIHESGLQIDPLIKMAIIHYQFEAIHPFGDGNGRTGRILNILYLMQEKLLDVPILFLSRYIIENKNSHYRGLQNVTENQDWEDWILYMLTAIENTSQRTLTLIENIQALMQESRDLIQKNAARGVYSKDLVELVFRQPYCRINSLIKASLTTSRITAKRYLKELVRLGVLEEIRYSGELLYLNIRLMSLLANS